MSSYPDGGGTVSRYLALTGRRDKIVLSLLRGGETTKSEVIMQPQMVQRSTRGEFDAILAGFRLRTRVLLVGVPIAIILLDRLL